MAFCLVAGAPAATQRIHTLAAAFEKRFGQKPELFARAPGACSPLLGTQQVS
jgi:hypothetical protein